MANTIKRQRAKKYKNEKITYCVEYGIDSICFYLAYGNHITLELDETVRDKNNYEKNAIKLLKIFFKLIDMEIKDILRYLKLKIVDTQFGKRLVDNDMKEITRRSVK